jgi:hypothetical protein
VLSLAETGRNAGSLVCVAVVVRFTAGGDGKRMVMRFDSWCRCRCRCSGTGVQRQAESPACCCPLLLLLRSGDRMAQVGLALNVTGRPPIRGSGPAKTQAVGTRNKTGTPVHGSSLNSISSGESGLEDDRQLTPIPRRSRHRKGKTSREPAHASGCSLTDRQV